MASQTIEPSFPMHSWIESHSPVIHDRRYIRWLTISYNSREERPLPEEAPPSRYPSVLAPSALSFLEALASQPASHRPRQKQLSTQSSIRITPYRCLYKKVNILAQYTRSLHLLWYTVADVTYLPASRENIRCVDNVICVGLLWIIQIIDCSNNSWRLQSTEGRKPKACHIKYL